MLKLILWLKTKLGILELLSIIVKLEVRIKQLEDLIERNPTVVSDASVVKEWKEAMDNLPVDSPKWTAYKNRLESLGYRHGG